MKWLYWRLTPALLFGFVGGGIGGCEPNNGVPPGAPVLQSFGVIDNTNPYGGPLEITSDAGPIEVTGYVHLTALFDRLLDPTTVTNLDDGGTDQGANVDTITFTPSLPAGVSISFNSIYVPNGGGLVFLPGPSINTMASPTFPSGATIMAQLDRSKIRSKKEEPFVGDPDHIVFHTLAFAASITVPMGNADPDAGADAGTPPVMPQMQAVTVAFTNLPKTADPMVPGDDDIGNHITVTQNGNPFTDVTIGPDGSGNPTIFDVAPTTAWPANATIVVTVDASAADALGSTTGAPTSASFTTSGN